MFLLMALRGLRTRNTLRIFTTEMAPELNIYKDLKIWNYGEQSRLFMHWMDYIHQKSVFFMVKSTILLNQFPMQID